MPDPIEVQQPDDIVASMEAKYGAAPAPQAQKAAPVSAPPDDLVAQMERKYGTQKPAPTAAPAPSKFGQDYAPERPSGNFQAELEAYNQQQKEQAHPWLYNPLGMVQEKGKGFIDWAKKTLGNTATEASLRPSDWQAAANAPTGDEKAQKFIELAERPFKTAAQGLTSGTIQLANAIPEGVAFGHRVANNLAQKAGYLAGMEPGTVNDIMAKVDPYQQLAEGAGLTYRKPGQEPAAVSETAQEIANLGQRTAPQNPGLVGTVSEMAPAIAATVLAPEVEIPAALGKIPVAGRAASYLASHPSQLVGGGLGASGQLQEAQAYGAPVSQQALAGLTGFGTGMVQGGAMGELLGPEAAQIGKGMHPVTRGLSMAAEGGLTMGTAQAVNNATAMLTYDPNRRVLDNVPEQIALGSLLAAPGALLHPSEPLAQRKLPIPREAPEATPEGQPQPPPPTFNGLPKLQSGHFDVSGLSPEQASDLYTTNNLKVAALRSQMAEMEAKGQQPPPAMMREYINSQAQAAQQGVIGEGASALPLAGVFSQSVRGDLEAAGTLPPHRVMFDLDNLKFANDILGHKGTDYLLQQIGNALGTDTPDGVMVFKGRNGDEFYAHSNAPISEEWAKTVADRIKNTHMDIVGEDGNVYEVKDTGISYGHGTSDEAAESSLKEMKDQKLSEGKRLTRAQVDEYLERRKAGGEYEGPERRAESEQRRAEDLGPAGRAIPRFVREANPGERGLVGLRQTGGEAGGYENLGAGPEASGGPGGGPLSPEVGAAFTGQGPHGTAEPNASGVGTGNQPAAGLGRGGEPPASPAEARGTVPPGQAREGGLPVAPNQPGQEGQPLEPERSMKHISPSGEKITTDLTEAHHVAAFDKLQQDSDELHQAISSNPNLTKEQRAEAHREVGKGFSQSKQALADAIAAEKAGGPKVGPKLEGPGLSPEEVKGLSAPTGTPEDVAARKAISAPVKQLIDMTRTDVNRLKTPEEMQPGKDPGVGWQMEQARSQEQAAYVMTMKAASLVKDLTPEMQKAIRDYEERPDQTRIAPYLQKISEEFTQPLVQANRGLAEQLWQMKGEKSKAFDDDAVNYATRRALPDREFYAQTTWQKLKEALNRRAAEPGAEPKGFEYQPALSTNHYSTSEGRTMKAVTDAEGTRQVVSMDEGGKIAQLGNEKLTRRNPEELLKDRTAKPLEDIKDAEAKAKQTFDSVLSRFVRNGKTQKWEYEDLKPEEAWRKLAELETPYNNDAAQRMTKALASLEEARQSYQKALEPFKAIDKDKPIYEGKDGKLYNLGQAATAEIEAQTPIRYDQNYVLNVLDQHQKLAQAVRNQKMLQEWGKSVEDGGFGVPLKDADGFRLKGPDGLPVPLPKGYAETKLQIPGVQDMAYPKMMARAMDHLQLEIDRAQNVDQVARAIANLTGLTTRSIFLSPVGHILNTSYHWMTSKGWEAYNPFTLADGGKSMIQGAKEIASMDPKVLDWMNDGAKMMSQRQSATDWKNTLDQSLREQLPQIDPKDPKLVQFAAKAGVDPAEVIKQIYKVSGSTLWLADDIMRLEALQWMEKRRPDLTRQQIIQEVNHHIASYESNKEIPAEVRKFVDNPYATMFNRYHIFRAGAFLGDLRDSVLPRSAEGKVDAEVRHEAMGRLAATALLATAVQPILSSLYKKAYNALPGKKDEEIKSPAAGPLAIGQLMTGLAGQTEAGQKVMGSLPSTLMQDIYEGPKTWQSAVQSNLTFNPFWIEAANQLSGKNILTGRQRSLGQMVAGPLETIAPIASAARVARGEVPAKQELASMLVAARSKGTPAMQTAKYHTIQSYGTAAPTALDEAQQEARTGIKTNLKGQSLEDQAALAQATQEEAAGTGGLSPKQIEGEVAKAKMTPSEELNYRVSKSQAFRGVNGPDRVMEVWRVATPDEKKAIQGTVQRILGSGLRSGAPLVRQRAMQLQQEFSRSVRNP